MATAQWDILQWTRKGCVDADANLRGGVAILRGNPQCLDTDFLAAVSALPYIGKATTGNRFVPDSGEITGYGVRGWEDQVVATDGL